MICRHAIDRKLPRRSHAVVSIGFERLLAREVA